MSKGTQQSSGILRWLEVAENASGKAAKQKKSFRNLHRISLGFLLNTKTCTHRIKLSELRKRATEP